MVQSYIILLVTVSSIIWKTASGLACFSCHSESDRSRCLTHQVECRDGLEECFFDKTTLQNSAVVYTAGCRSKAVCDLLGNAVGKRDDISRSRRTSVVCAQCCNTAPKNRIPCNAQLCDDRLTCLSCHSVSDISKCLTHHTVCQGPDEECYLDKTILPNLSTAYNAGCRAKTVCSLLSGAVGKRNVDIQLQRLRKASISCSECCNTQPDRSGVPCNRNLCKLGTSASAYETCGVCDRVASPGVCHVSQVCPPNEVCTVNSIFSGGVVIYELGCELKTVCDATLKIYKGSHGKRAGHGDLVLCSACCSGKNCNTKGDCSTLIRRTYKTQSITNRFDGTKSAECKLCMAGPEDYKHFLIKCESLNCVRKNHHNRLKSLLKYNHIPYCSIINSEDLLEFLVDCSRNDLITVSQQRDLERICKDWIYALHAKRAQLLENK